MMRNIDASQPRASTCPRRVRVGDEADLEIWARTLGITVAELQTLIKTAGSGISEISARLAQPDALRPRSSPDED
ncbi:hypothetical protein BH09PSE5_BH09PSE5_00950 [soil metagenome]